jgi:hypothetical protein
MRITKNFYACFLFFIMVSFLQGELFAQTALFTLKASKSYNPDQYVDFDSTLLNSVKFAIPEFLTVTGGSAGNGTATLKLYNEEGDSVLVTYKGIVNQSNQGNNKLAPGQLNKVDKYFFQSSSNGMQAGDSIIAERFQLRVDNGSSLAGTTAIEHSLLVFRVATGSCSFIGVSVTQGCGVTLTALGVPSGSTVKWEVYFIVPGTGMVSPRAALTGNGIIINGLAPGSYIFIAFVYDASGTYCGYSNTQATIGSSLNVTASASPSGCLSPGTLITLTASSAPGASYSWKDASGAIIGKKASITVNPTLSTEYTVKASKAGICGTAKVTVNVMPIIFLAGPGVCPGGSLMLNLNRAPVAGESFQWLKNGLVIAGATNSTYAATTAGNYNLQATFGGVTCTSNTLTVNMLPGVSIPSLTDVHRCGPGQVTLSVNNPTGSGYQWFTAATGGSFLASGTTYSTSISSTTTYYVQSSSFCGTSARTAVTAFADPIFLSSELLTNGDFSLPPDGSGNVAGWFAYGPGTPITYADHIFGGQFTYGFGWPGLYTEDIQKIY